MDPANPSQDKVVTPGAVPAVKPTPAAAADLASAPDVAQQALAGAQAAVDQLEQDISPAPLPLPDFAPDGAEAALLNSIDLLGDVELHVTIELGRTHMLVEDVLRLGEGSIVELDKLAGDPVDVYVNNRLVARGEVLVLNDNFCIRISEIVADLEQEAAAAAQEVVKPS